MARPINRRVLATVCVFMTLGVIIVTSVLMFFKGYSNKVALVHTVVGLSFLALAVWHLFNNFKAIKSYLSPSSFLSSSKYGYSPVVALAFSIGLLVFSIIEIQPFKRFHQWGLSMRLSDQSEASQASTLSYDIIENSTPGMGREIKIDFKKGSNFHWPQYAIWVEKPDGSFVQPLYVTRSVGDNTFKNTVALADSTTVFKSNPFSQDDFKFESTFTESYDENAKNNRYRPESLPVFLHKTNRKNLSNSAVNGEQVQSLDGYTGATLFNNYIVSQNIKDTKSQRYTIFLEINQSFDYNKYYASDSFPDDPVYSGNGFSAQPSLIYSVEIDFSSATKIYPMSLAGHGHHSGKTGEIYSDVGNLTTALNIVDRIIVDIR